MFTLLYQVDVIVNSASSDLQLQNGAVSASILKEAGQEIQDECTRNKGIQPGSGDIVVTNGYRLQCSKVIHTSLPQWRSGGEQVRFLHKL
jgi:O-acetyl-ADP-ribose deacetylase (regulator of RNase III)